MVWRFRVRKRHQGFLTCVIVTWYVLGGLCVTAGVTILLVVKFGSHRPIARDTLMYSDPGDVNMDHYMQVMLQKDNPFGNMNHDIGHDLPRRERGSKMQTWVKEPNAFRLNFTHNVERKQFANANNAGNAGAQWTRPGDTLDANIDALRVKDLPYLENYRNPCWYEDLPRANPYRLNFFKLTGRDVYKNYFNPWAPKVTATYYNGVRNRLRCLPLVYQVGISKCGTTDLYFALAQHPWIVTGGYKEPHYWSLFRFRGYQPTTNQPSVPLRDYLDLYDEAATTIEDVLQDNSAFHPAVTGGTISF